MHVVERAGLLALIGMLALLVFGGRPVHAGQPPSQDAVVEQRLRLIWRPASVAWPLDPLGRGDFEQLAAGLEQREAMLAGRESAPSVRGVVEIDRQRAAGVWIAALETVRVRQLDGDTPLRFIRGVDGHAAVIEPGRALPAGPGGERRWELSQPPSDGAIWSIEADEPTRILIERVEPRPPLYVAVELEVELLEWIAAGRANAELPALLEPSGELADRLHLDAALGRELLRLGGDRQLARAIEAWRMLGAMAAIDRERPAMRPYFARTGPLALADTNKTRLNVDDTRNYRLAEQPRRWTLDRKGPGQLHIAARSWAPLGQTLQAAELRIHAGGRVIERIPLSPRQARRAVDPDTAVPQLEPLATDAGEPVGELIERTIVLAPGRHEYVLELVGGPALLTVEASRRIESTAASVRGWTPRKRALAATRALRRSDAAAKPWLELLLGERTHVPSRIAIGDPRFLELGRQSPLLASATLLLAARSAPLDRDLLAQLIARVQPWLSALDRDRSIDPGVRGQLRARWLELIALHDRPELAAAVIRRDPEAGNDPIAELPIAGLRTLAELLVPTRATARSSTLALLELARRRAPADEELRGWILLAWSESSRWSRRQPLPHGAATIADIDDEFRPIGEWLVPREAEPVDAVELANTWLRLEPGKPARVQAELGELPRSSGGRMRLIDVHVATPPDSREPALLRVDDRQWWSPQLFGVQRHRVAIGPGVHEFELDAPAGTIAWVGAPPHDTTTFDQLGRRERMWPLAHSVWKLPGPPVPGFVRLELRWPEGVPPQTVQIRVIEAGDEDHERIVLFDPPREWDEQALPIDGSARATARHDVVLPIAAATTELRFELDPELPIAAALSLRRGPQTTDFAVLGSESEPVPNDVDALFDSLAGLDRDALLDELRALSHRLLDSPDDLAPRARRAALLLLLGETGHARADLLRLAAYADRESILEIRRERALELLDALEQRFEALTDPREITVANPERVATPELIEPAIAAVAGEDRERLEPWLEHWAAIRGANLDEALAHIDAQLDTLRARPDDDPQLDTQLLLGALTRAHLLAREPTRAREAARAWLSLYGRMPGSLAHVREPIAVGIASVAPLLAHLDDPHSDAADAGLAFGLARELEPAYGHATLRRLAFVAALRSDWARLDHSENNAGFERLELPVAELQPTPEAEIRDALLVAPWPGHEAEQLGTDRKGVVAWDASPGTVIAELWCRALRPDLAPDRAALADRPAALGTAKLQLRLRSEGRDHGVIDRELELRDAERGTVELPIARAGRHQLEVTLADDPIWRCSWRNQTRAADQDPELLEAHRRAQWWTAGPNRAVELIVLGPTSLELEIRGVAGSDAHIVLASIERLDFEHALPPEQARFDQGRLPLATTVERAVITERRRHFDVTHAASHTLLLTEPVPHRIRLLTDRGRVLIRARMRRDRGDLPPPTRVSIHELRAPAEQPTDQPDFRTFSPGVAILARDTVPPVRNRIGTLELRTTVGLDQLGEVDDLRPRLGLVASVGWRRALVDELLWLALAGEARLREQTAPAGGGSLRLAARLPPIGVRTGAELDVLAQPFGGRTESSVRLSGFADRPTWLGPHVQLRPGLTVGLRWQSLDPERVAAATTELDPHPRIYQRYIHDHPVLLQPEFELRVYPFSDMVVWTEAQVIPNSDIQSLDHVNVELGTAGIARRPRPWVPTWGLSYQASPRFVDANRETAFVRHRIETELGFGVWVRDSARVAFGVTHQLFMSSVAPVRNVIELWLRIDASFGRRMRDHGPRELWLREPWAPRAWGDDQHQARSTTAPYER
jgi:hypothetical protein